MSNTVISNNGNEAQDGNPADPAIKITNLDTDDERILAPGVSVGLAHGRYLVEVI